MSDSVVCRMYLAGVGAQAYSPDALDVTLRVVSRGDENKVWSAATPTGEMKLAIKNAAATAIFRTDDGRGYLLNDEYEIVITRLPKTPEP